MNAYLIVSGVGSENSRFMKKIFTALREFIHVMRMFDI